MALTLEAIIDSTYGSFRTRINGLYGFELWVVVESVKDNGFSTWWEVTDSGVQGLLIIKTQNRMEAVRKFHKCIEVYQVDCGGK